MARKRNIPPVGSKPNPLQRMFGTYLRLERRRLSLESDRVANELGLTETYYRLVESGRATLNQGLVFKLVGLLSNDSAGSGSTTARIHFQRLALYLVGSHWVSAQMTALKITKQTDLLAVEALASRDADFELFHRKTKGYYALQEEDEKQRRFLEDIAAPCVSNFLATIDYARPTRAAIVEQVMPAEKLLALPTLNVEMITRLLADLSDRPFVHTPRVASAWEDRTSPLIRSVHGIFVRPDLIINQRNLAYFHYPYLMEPRFRQLRFVFLKTGNAKQTKTAFVRMLNSERVAANLEPIGEKHAQKITFVMLTDHEREQYLDRIRTFCTRSTSDGQTSVYDAYWSFESATDMTVTDIPIGFVGSIGASPDDIWNLSLAESVEKSRDFDNFWNDLEPRPR